MATKERKADIKWIERRRRTLEMMQRAGHRSAQEIRRATQRQIDKRLRRLTA